MADSPLRIAVSGAGVGGAILTYLLRDQPGVEVVCLEQVAENDHSQAGTGLNVGPNALKSLAQAAPELAASLRAPGVSLPWRHWRTTLTDGTPLMDLPLSQVADNDGIRIRWSELYDRLRAPLHDRILFNRQVTGTEQEPDGGRIHVHYRNGADGRTETLRDLDLLVGGDGRYSMVRRRFIGEPKPHHLGVVIFRLLVPDTTDGLIDDYEQWFNGANRLLAFRVPGERIYIAGAFPIKVGAPIADDVKEADTLRDFFTPANGQPSASARFLIDALCERVEEIHWARVQDIDPACTDETGRVLLLGDAAHAMVPTLGQGATMAVEDACAYADGIRAAVREANGGPVSVPALTRRIAAMRAERVRFVMDFSRQASDTLLPGSDPVRDSRKKMEAPFLDQLKRLYRDTPALSTFPSAPSRVAL